MTPGTVMNFTKCRVVYFIGFISLVVGFTSSHVYVWFIHTIQVHLSSPAAYLSLNRILILLAHIGWNQLQAH